MAFNYSFRVAVSLAVALLAGVMWTVDVFWGALCTALLPHSLVLAAEVIPPSCAEGAFHARRHRKQRQCHPLLRNGKHCRRTPRKPCIEPGCPYTL